MDGQCVNTITYNFVNNICLYHLNEIFEFAPLCRIDFAKLKNPFRKPNMGEKQVLTLVPLYVTACLTQSKN